MNRKIIQIKIMINKRLMKMKMIFNKVSHKMMMMMMINIFHNKMIKNHKLFKIKINNHKIQNLQQHYLKNNHLKFLQILNKTNPIQIKIKYPNLIMTHIGQLKKAQ